MLSIYGAFLSFAPSVIVSLLTAVATVLLTFYERNKNEKISSLKALSTELSQNDVHTEMIAHDLFQFREGVERVSDMRTTLPLEDSAYELVKNSGILATLPPTSRESIHYHYTVVRSLNRKLEQRSEIQYNAGTARERSAISEIDKRILSHIINLSDLRRLEVIAANLRENEAVETEFEEASESQPDEREIDEDLPRQTYDGVSEFVEQEIEAESIRKRLLDWFYRIRSKST